MGGGRLLREYVSRLPNLLWPHTMLASAHAKLGQLEERWPRSRRCCGSIPASQLVGPSIAGRDLRPVEKEVACTLAGTTPLRNHCPLVGNTFRLIDTQCALEISRPRCRYRAIKRTTRHRRHTLRPPHSRHPPSAPSAPLILSPLEEPRRPVDAG